MTTETGLEFLIDRKEWNKTRFVETSATPALDVSQVLFRVDRFAFTANNITYALAGDMLGYWKFFPKAAGWGCLPAMGYGNVVASSHRDVAVGTRCFGFFPMARTLVVEPSVVKAGSIVEGAAHRKGLAPAYNQYQPVTTDPLYTAQHEDALALLRGLFTTSFLAEDFLSDSDGYGAEAIVISSASSKTSIALAFVAQQQGRMRPVGLTSARNLEFVNSLGLYDSVLTYEAVGDLSDQTKSVFVDMAGNSALTRAVHERLGSNLMFSQRIGGTHWDAGGDDSEMPGPEREFFFAPGQIKKRLAEWGPALFQERVGKSLHAFIESSASWLDVERGYGREAVERVYAQTLDGSASPATGHVISLWESEAEAAKF